MRKYLFIFLMITISLIWLFVSEKNSKKNSSTKEHEQQTNEVINQDNKLDIMNQEPASNHKIDVYLASKDSLRKIEYLSLPRLNKEIVSSEHPSFKIDNLRKTLDEINGDYDNLDLVMALSLATALKVCKGNPRTQLELEEYENSYYFVSGGEKSDKEFFYKMCTEVTDEELAMAYPLMERAANAGLTEAILSFLYADVPGYTASEIATFEEMSPENQKILSKHNKHSVGLLEKLVENGNISAVFELGGINRVGYGQPVNKKRALTYLLVHAAVSQNQLLVTITNENIAQIAKNLYERDIIEARQQAQGILNQWEELEVLYQ